jgi:hypothetical protein
MLSGRVLQVGRRASRVEWPVSTDGARLLPPLPELTHGGVGRAQPESG